MPAGKLTLVPRLPSVPESPTILTPHKSKLTTCLTSLANLLVKPKPAK